MEPYDYLNNSLMSQEDIEHMVELNPYRRHISLFCFIKTETSEHRRFNEIYATGYSRGACQKLLEMSNLLQERGMEKEDIRLMINQVLGREILKPKTDVPS